MKTVRVRAAVAVDPETGEWNVFGCDNMDDEYKVDQAIEGLDVFRSEVTWITADIPIREPQTVEAEVESDD